MDERLQEMTEASNPDPVTSDELLIALAATKPESGDHTTEPYVTMTSPEQSAPPGPQKPTLVDRLYTDPFQTKLVMYRRTAKVVYIVEEGHSRFCAGHLKCFDKERKQALFSPKDRKVPFIKIPLSSCPHDYPKNPKKYKSKLFISEIEQWRRNSPYPQGKLLHELGKAGEIEPETNSFLTENQIDYAEFQPDVHQCLPQIPWTIPQKEEDQRRNFRQKCIFSIDPETATDLDDALHVEEVKKDVYEVGVHIADVSYFVKPDTALDQTASRRATSVYLVQKVIPMLPKLLCEDLCSLKPNEDRLAFSVVWKMTIHGELIDEWMGRSIIRSCAKLSYSHAQDMIENPEREWRSDELPMISSNFSASEVSKAVHTLNRLAGVLKRQRQSKGVLKLIQPKLKFILSEQTGLPNKCDVHKQLESHSLVEEFMLLANMAVAHKIWNAHPQVAMLRRHPSPKETTALILKQECHKLGFQLDASSAASIQQSLDQYNSTGRDEVLKKMVLVSRCIRIMQPARYFCTGSVGKRADFWHYALNAPLYTHFTSPIRRYADIVVHRQLASALAGEDSPFSVDDVTAMAKHCNKKRNLAKIVEDKSVQMFFAIYLKEGKIIKERGIVVYVLDRSFDVLVERYGVRKRIYCDKLSGVNYEFQEKTGTEPRTLVLKWTETNKTQVLTVMSIVKVVLTGGSKPLEYEAKIIPPS